MLFGAEYTEFLLTNGNSYVVRGNYEEIIEELFDDSGQLLRFFSIDDSFINVSQIVEVRKYSED